MSTFKTGSASKTIGSALFNQAGSLRTSGIVKPDANLVSKILREETDERYRYLVRHGNLHLVDTESLTIYVELTQIPNVIIVYRRPSERKSNPEKLSLEHRGLKHVPLLEGEEKLK